MKEIQAGTQPLLLDYGRIFFMDDLSMTVLFLTLKDDEKRFFLKRLDRNGDIDHSFGTQGISELTVLNEKSLTLIDGVVLADGSMIFGFETRQLNGRVIYLTKTLPSGTVDTTFSDHGFLKVTLNSSVHGLRFKRKNDSQVMIVDPDCRAMNSRHTVLNSTTGDLIQTQPCTPTYDKNILSIDSLPNGQSLISSCDSDNCKDGLLIERFDQEGNVDQGFAKSGKARIPFSTFAPLAHDRSDHFKVRMGGTKDGKVLMSWSFEKGTFEDHLITHHHLTRVLQDGRIDETFGIQGTVTMFSDMDLSCSNSDHRGPASQPVEIFNELVVTAAVGDSRTCILRLDRNGQPDRSFGTDGIIKTNTGFNSILTNDRFGPNGYYRLKLLGFHVGLNGALTLGFLTTTGMLGDHGIVVNRYLY